jgi:hypothetical protein
MSTVHQSNDTILNRRCYGGSLKITHSAITSSVFELVKTILLDLTLAEVYIPTRIEIWQDTEQKDSFRCYIWELENFNLTPTFLQDETANPLETCTEEIQVERSWRYSRTQKFVYNQFKADSVETALQMVLENVKAELKYITGEEAH